ncbi:MAG: hypothetical protein KKB81_00005, partial [Candidatus Margulisbacteria bacterium]|nr:hypothetical protein [Candidatus Margulisiibacteriota bacterium]MBU1021798.1 hypothetical protein [Candidatus Margulisiibacteriota bacterium]
MPHEIKYESNEYSINFKPSYPLIIGEKTYITFATVYPASAVSIEFKKEKTVQLVKEGDKWVGTYIVPAERREGWWPLYVYIKFKRNGREVLVKREMWHRAFKRESPSLKLSLGKEDYSPHIISAEALPVKIDVSQEEAREGLIIRGDKSLAFTSHSIEGSKEGYTPGVSREESLRVNISGKVSGTDVDANLFSTSTVGTSQLTEREDKISVRLKRGETEAYFGDFTADISDVEFCKLNKVLSGVQISGDYKRFGFKALMSTPKGSTKLYKAYGNNTQGPYALGFAPVVIDSEQVYVDGILQKRGDDYEIDYEAGTVTFLNRTIQDISIIRVEYDYRETTYDHSTYGLRVKGKINDSLSLGATYINDSDSAAGAETIRSNLSSAVNPESHYVIGTDGTLILGDFLIAQGEVAYSEKNLDILSASSTKEAGKAAKIKASSQLGPVNISGNYKRVGANFESISDPDPKTNIWDYGGEIAYQPNSLFLAKVESQYDKYTENSLEYEIQNRRGKAKITPTDLPDFHYILDEQEDNRDPVSGAIINRIITKNQTGISYVTGLLKTTVSGGVERRLNRYPTEEATTYQTIDLGLATVGIEKITASGNIELKTTELPDMSNYAAQTYNLNLSASPNQQYFVSAVLSQVYDELNGDRSTANLAFSADPFDIL